MRRVSAPSEKVVIIGAGSATLVDALASERRVLVIDISRAALESLRERLGDRADVEYSIEYIVSDVRELDLPTPVDVWHDRATFHFLVDHADQRHYADHAASAVRPGGHLVIATIAPTGPTSCIGLPVCRYDADSLRRIFGDAFDMIEVSELDHRAPSGVTQRFTHALLRRTFQRHGMAGQDNHETRSVPTG